MGSKPPGQDERRESGEVGNQNGCPILQLAASGEGLGGVPPISDHGQSATPATFGFGAEELEKMRNDLDEAEKAAGANSGTQKALQRNNPALKPL